MEIWSESMSEEIDLDLVEKVIHQLPNDWYDKRHRDIAVWLIRKLSKEDVEQYLIGVE